jgi:hypothetical protein
MGSPHHRLVGQDAIGAGGPPGAHARRGDPYRAAEDGLTLEMLGLSGHDGSWERETFLFSTIVRNIIGIP